jgi:hypothetical protein
MLERIIEVETFASWGCIRFEKTSLVSQAGFIDSSHAEIASAFRCREALCLARASGLPATTLPIKDAFERRWFARDSVEVETGCVARWASREQFSPSESAC